MNNQGKTEVHSDHCGVAVTTDKPSTIGITGYRALSKREIDLMNEVKAKGEEMAALMQKVRDLHTDEIRDHHRAVACGNSKRTGAEQNYLTAEGQRNLIRAQDELQVGLMLLNRAIARPTTFA